MNSKYKYGHHVSISNIRVIEKICEKKDAKNLIVNGNFVPQNCTNFICFANGWISNTNNTHVIKRGSDFSLYYTNTIWIVENNVQNTCTNQILNLDDGTYNLQFDWVIPFSQTINSNLTLLGVKINENMHKWGFSTSNNKLKVESLYFYFDQKNLTLSFCFLPT